MLRYCTVRSELLLLSKELGEREPYYYLESVVAV
jgi:hypothetical protein